MTPRKRRADRVNPAVKVAGQLAFDSKGRPKSVITRMVDRAVQVQRPLVVANLRRLHRRYPYATPAQLAARLERDYLYTITGTGAAVGGTAVVPAIGTMTSLGLSAAVTVGFLEATALYAQSIAELHGLQVDEPERARALVMAILLGEEGGALVASLAAQGAGRGGSPMRYWGAVLTRGLPTNVLRLTTGPIRKRFMRKLLARQGSVFLGRVLPLGIGAVVGGAGNNIMGRAVVRTTAGAFGPLPFDLPGALRQELDR